MGRVNETVNNLTILTDFKLTLTGRHSERHVLLITNIFLSTNDFLASTILPTLTRTSFHRTALQILSAVPDVFDTSGTPSVTTVGHTLCAALSLLDSIYFRLQLPAGTIIRVVVYGLPRIGNQDWPNFVDLHLPSTITYITSKAYAL